MSETLQYGRMALEVVLKSILGQTTTLTEPPADYSGDFFNGKFRVRHKTTLLHQFKLAYYLQILMTQWIPCFVKTGITIARLAQSLEINNTASILLVGVLRYIICIFCYE